MHAPNQTDTPLEDWQSTRTDQTLSETYRNINRMIPRARMEPSPAKTKMKVERNSDKVPLKESGWVASSALPKSYLRGITLPFFVAVYELVVFKFAQ